MTEIELLARANGLSSIPSIAREKLTERCPQDRYRTERKLSVHELVISYEDVQTGGLTEAVHKVSLDMAPGEFVTIVGLSGCGKTSFLSAVAGLLKPRQGSIALNGAPVRGPGADRAVVFQKPSLLPWRTALRNITYSLELNGVSKKAALARAGKFIAMVRLNGFEHFYPGQLSDGMQQRVNLARALVCEPEVLLLDEPFGALDAITRESMQNELLALWEATEKTVLMVTHQIDEAVLLSDRVIVFSARPAEIIDEIVVNLPRPRTPEIKQDARFDDLTARIWRLIHQSSRKEMRSHHENQEQHHVA